MRRLIDVFLFILIISITGCSKTSADLTINKGILTIGIDISYPPMEYFGPDGRTPIGFDVEMGKVIAERLGFEAEFINTSWDGIFAGVETNRYDCIISSVTILPERLIAYNFTKPYIGNSLVIITLKNSEVKPRSPQELEGLAVAYQAETTAKFFMKKLMEDGLKYLPFEYDLGMSCFDELLLGRVDAVIADRVIAQEFSNKPDSQFEITWFGEADQFFGICMKKGNDTLTEALENVLDELFTDGTMRRISMDYLNADMVSGIR
jgi:polar amino acid transport system substrate-binding protein